MYIQPTLDAFSGSNGPMRRRAVASLIAGYDPLKFALALVFVTVALGGNAQTYSVGPDTSKAPQAQTNKTQIFRPAAGLGVEYSECAPCARRAVGAATREPCARA